MNPQQNNLRIKMVKVECDKNNMEKWLEQMVRLRCTICETLQIEIYLKARLQ